MISFFSVSHIVGAQKGDHTFQNVASLYSAIFDRVKMADIESLRDPCAELKGVHVRDLVLEPVDVQDENLRHLAFDDHLLFSLVFAALSLKRTSQRPVLAHLLDHHNQFILDNFKFGSFILLLLTIVVDQTVLSVDHFLSVNKVEKSILMTGLYLGFAIFALASQFAVGV